MLVSPGRRERARAPSRRTCTVSLRRAAGSPYFSHTTMGTSLFAAVARAIEFFESDFWKGPKPTPTTVFRVTLVADERSFDVPASAVELWRARRSGRDAAPSGSA